MIVTFCIFCFLCLNYAVGAPQVSNELPGGRIVGGHDADILNYPYQASVRYLNFHRCGGVIIARTWILTANHCISGFDEPSVSVRVGSSYREVGGEIYNVKKLIHHSEYDLTTHKNDIALLQLETPLVLSRSVQIAGLAPNINIEIEGYVANVTGWGYTEEHGVASDVLQALEIPIFSQTACKEIYPSYLYPDITLCAGLWEGGKDACTGDGGGPLVINSIVYGLVSWGQGCARPQYPGVYTNVGALRDWITEKTGI